jgi:hypothetical protein
VNDNLSINNYPQNDVLSLNKEPNYSNKLDFDEIDMDARISILKSLDDRVPRLNLEVITK